MKFTQCLIPTLKENPQEAECKSHRLMLRAGLIRKLASGTYSYLPLGLRVLQKAERIVREEMNRTGALEVLLPALHPAEIWQETGRDQILKDVMFAFKDRHGRENMLGPTHEEIITDLVRREIRSYRQLPMSLYQIQTKFRDEARPRSGVIRSREFIMKDAYSFHATPHSLDETYETMKKAYCRIFERCGLKYHIVEADPGAMGGSGSQEFVLFSDAGEDRVAQIGETKKVMSVEMAPRKVTSGAAAYPKEGRFKDIATPGCSSIESVAALLKAKPNKLVKTMIYQSDARIFAVLVRGDHEVSEYKLKKLEPGAHMADRKTIEQVGTAFGYSGPIGLKMPFYIDRDVMDMENFIVGANRDGFHTVGVRVGDFFDPSRMTVGDFRQVVEGDLSEDGSPLNIRTAIELGHIFKLNLRYSEPMKAHFLDESGKEKPVIMGCYGIGVNRIVAAAVEQAGTDKGIVWPSLAISPYEIQILPLNMNDEETKQTAFKLYDEMLKRGWDVLIDDREVTAGIKFNDADLLGVPIQVILGAKNLKEGKIELRRKDNGSENLVPAASALEEIQKLLDNMK